MNRSTTSTTSQPPAKMSDAGPLLAIDAVQYAYHRTVALRGVSLTIEPGEVVAITGPSGCGKSTLLHLAAGLIWAQAGSARLFGLDLSSASADDLARLRRTRLSMVLQFGQLVPELPGLDNVALPLLLNGHDRATARTLAHEWLDRCDAAELAAMLPAEMSGGQAQRVAVARSLVTSPELILADEPTGSLDSLGGRELLDLMLAEVRRSGAALVIVTHDNLVAARADRELRMLDGVIASQAVLT